MKLSPKFAAMVLLFGAGTLCVGISVRFNRIDTLRGELTKGDVLIVQCGLENSETIVQIFPSGEFVRCEEDPQSATYRLQVGYSAKQDGSYTLSGKNPFVQKISQKTESPASSANIPTRQAERLNP
jgi:hypothetical protein